MLVLAAFLQAPSSPLVFEAATVKPATSPELSDRWGTTFPASMRGGPGTADPSRISFATLRSRRSRVAGYRMFYSGRARESRRVPVYLLTVGKSGPKLARPDDKLKPSKASMEILVIDSAQKMPLEN